MLLFCIKNKGLIDWEVGSMGKVTVTLRERAGKKGRSLYLDIYANGKRKYEFLGLRLVDEATRADRQENKRVKELAERVRAKRLLEIQEGRFGFSGGRGNTPFLPYFRAMVEARKGKGSYWPWHCAYMLVKRYASEETSFRDIDSQWIDGLRGYLEDAKRKDGKPLAANTKATCWQRIACVLHTAAREGIISNDQLGGMEGFRQEETERVYLTIDEVRELAKTPCNVPDLKRAFLFSCLTGLRASDIERLTWEEVQEFDGGRRIIFRQKKTKGQEYLDISKQAYALMGDRGEDGEKVFGSFHYHGNIGEVLRRWARAAGITKHITFHSGRHTFAMMMLGEGIDIYTVSKLLGHMDLSTTQIYAKVVDEKKREAVNLFPSINWDEGE